MPKYIRTVGQAESLLHEYEDEIIKLNRLIESEDNEKTQKVLKELLEENMEAKKRLERFLNDNPSIFK